MASEGSEERTERLDRLLAAVPDYVAVLDDTGRIRYINRTAPGVSEEDILGVPAREMVAPAERPRLDESLRRVVEDRVQVSYQVTSVLAGTEGRTYSVSLAPFAEDEAPLQVILMARDVTGEVEARRTRDHLAKRFQAYLESGDDVAFTLDPDTGAFTHVSDAFPEVTGWPRAEWVGRDFLEILHPEDREEAVERFQAALEGQVADPTKLRVRHQDGSHIHMSFAYRAILEDGRVQEVFGIARDISDLARAEAEARMLQGLANELAEARDREEAYDVFLHRFLEHEDWDIAEMWVAPRKAADTLQREHCVHHLGARGDAWCGADPSPVDSEGLQELARSRGEVLWLEDAPNDPRFARRRQAAELGLRSAVAVPIPGEDGVEAVILCFSGEPQERSARAEAFLNSVAVATSSALSRLKFEEALQESARELEHHNRQLRSLARVSAHQFREPVRDIVRFAQILERGLNDEASPETRENLSYILAGGNRLEALSDALLDYTEAATGERDLHPVDLGAVLDRVLDESADEIERAGARVTVAEDPPTVVGNEASLRTVVGELLENALTFHGDDPPEAHISWERVGDAWRIQVTDRGLGIPSQHHERVFRPFETLHHRSEFPGVGVGLPVARQLVESMDGHMWLGGDVEEGTTVFLTLPAAPS